MKATLKKWFNSLKEENLVLTVDLDRVYRVYHEEDRLSFDGRVNFSEGSTLCSFADYKSAKKFFEAVKTSAKREYDARLLQQALRHGFKSTKEIHEFATG
jgi:hypothetical protein